MVAYKEKDTSFASLATASRQNSICRDSGSVQLRLGRRKKEVRSINFDRIDRISDINILGN
jgi:hypothetical protein